MMGNIFNRYNLNKFIEFHRIKLREEIENLEITDTTNVLLLIENFKREYIIEPLQLNEPIPSEPIETKRERKNNWNEIYEQKIFEIKVTIPFDGNSELFYCQPSSSVIIWIDKSVNVGKSNITANIELEILDPILYQTSVNKIISDLSSNIPTINNEIAPWNNNLENLVKYLLEQRKLLVSKKFDFMEKIGLKVNPKSDDFMLPPPIAKKTIPTPISEINKNVKKERVPVLQDDVYKDIIEVIYNVGRAIERKPSLYLSKHEEDIRDIFLLFLETRYESTNGVGEAFNKKGKTDILLKYAVDGSNLFVAECKFWSGKKNFLTAIDQLLSYLTHRDSKTALMIFVSEKDLISKIHTIKEEIKTHIQFKSYIKENYETSISYEFTLPSDNQKIIQIEVMFFHFPSIK